MGPFLPLFSIGVEHDFFDDGLWHDVRFVASPDTATLIEKAGFLCRTMSNGISLYYDQSRIDALRLFLDETEGKLVFRFKVYASDGAYKLYSEAFVSAHDALPYFVSDRGVQDGDRVRLHHSSEVSESDMEAIESESIESALTPWDQRPAFVVSIAFSPAEEADFADALQAVPTSYFLRFGARQTYWTYYLLGPYVSKRVSIVDLDGGIAFESLGTVPLSDDRPALAFRSKAAIPLRQRPMFRLQLREEGAGNGKVLVKRLPVAGASQMARQAIGGEVVSVSEVYVNG